MAIQLKNNSFINGKLTVGGSTASAYQLGVDGSIATTNTVVWGMSTLGGSPSYTMGVDSNSYLEIDEVTSGGTLKIDTDNTRIGSSQVYLEGGLTSAVPSQYLGRVTGSGGGVMVGRTAAQVRSDIGAGTGTVTGTGTANYISKWSSSTEIENSVIYESGSKIGIGATFLSELFEIHGSDPSMVIKNTSYGSGESTLVFQTAMGAKNYLACNSSNALNYKSTAGSTLFTIENSGDVGIGTTTPSRKLQVIGTDGAAKFYYNSSFTNSQYSVVDVGMMTSGTAANGFGPKITFRMGGNGYDGYAAGTIGTIRNGADTSHDLTFGTSDSGSMSTALRLDKSNNAHVGASMTIGSSANGQLNLKDSGTTYLQMFKLYGTSFINTGTDGSTIHFGNSTTFVQNVNVAGFLDADNFKINGAQGTNGQVLTSSGSGVSWQTPTSGTITGSGTSGQIPIWSGTSSITSNSSFKEISTGKIYAESQFQVKGINDADYTVASDTDTGLGSFDGANGVSLVSKAKKQITVKEGDIKFDPYIATAVSTTGPISPNQGNQAPTQDTLAALCVDPSGNVVRGEQEATFKFTRAQLNSTLGQTLISAPGADKAVVVTYTDYMMEYSSTGTTSNNLEIRQANYASANASVSVLPSLRFNEIVSQSQSGSAPFYGFYTRDIPTGSGSQGRTYAVNKATTIHKQNSGAYPSGLTSISIKIRYRIFDVDTF